MSAQTSFLDPALARRGPRRLWWCFLAGVLLLGALVYHPVRLFEFLNLDDELFVRDNPWLAMGWHWPSLRWAVLANLTEYSSHAEYWSPLTLLTRLADASCFGMNAGAFHVTSLLLHLLNTVLLAAALRQLTGHGPRSMMVALLFLVHPLNAEAVCWLSARKDLLNATFALTTLLAYGWYVRRQTTARYAAVLVAYACCLMAKPMGVTIPLLLLILDVWPLRRWPSAPGTWPERGRLVAEKLPLLLLAILAAALAVVSQRDWGALQNTARYPVGVRIENALLSYGTYARRVLLPDDLTIYYPHAGDTISHGAVALSAAFLMLASLAAWHWRRRFPMFLAGWLWFGLLLGPVIGLVQIGGQAMADRYMYLAIIGPLVALVWGIAGHVPKRIALPLGAVALALASCLCAAQALTYRDSLTVFTRALAVTRANPVAHMDAGCALIDAGLNRDAAAHLHQAVAYSSRNALAWSDLARAEALLGHRAAAIECYCAALELEPTHRQSLLFLGRLLKSQGSRPQAEMIFLRLREAAPELPQAYAELGDLYAASGRWAKAADSWAGYLRIRPADAEIKDRLKEARGRLATTPGAL